MEKRSMYMGKSSYQIMEEINAACMLRRVVGIIEIIIALAIFGSWITVILSEDNEDQFGIVIFCAFGYIVVAAIVYGMFSSKVTTLYKNYFVASTVMENFDNAYYNHEEGYSRDLVKGMGFTMMGNRYSSEDFISASYKGVPFQRADVEVQYHSSNGKTSHTTTYFRGIVYRFKIKNRYPVALQIRSLDDRYAAFPMGVSKRDKIQTESIQFNQMFRTFCQDGHMAFYILTPVIIEKLCRLEANFGPMVINFIGDEVVVALNRNEDSLEPPSVARMDYETEKRRVLNQLAEVCIFIDELFFSN